MAPDVIDRLFAELRPLLESGEESARALGWPWRRVLLRLASDYLVEIVELDRVEAAKVQPEFPHLADALSDLGAGK